jgi:predicted transcriptional regulator
MSTGVYRLSNKIAQSFPSIELMDANTFSLVAGVIFAVVALFHLARIVMEWTTLLTALIGLATAQSLTRLAAPSGGQAGRSTSVGGENLIAYDLDRLFRAERRANADLDYPRAQAARILLTTASHRGMQPEDRAYLVRLTAANTGLAQPDAERRVDEVAARAKENISRARRSAVILAFTAGAAALLGAAAAWFAACAGGRVRDGEDTPHALLDWGRPVRRT